MRLAKIRNLDFDLARQEPVGDLAVKKSWSDQNLRKQIVTHYLAGGNGSILGTVSY